MFTKHEIKTRIIKLRAEGKALPADYNLACFIADAALIFQQDKAGVAYADHTTEVSRYNTNSMTKMIIGKLHDVVEDSDWTLDDLRDVGFSERVVAAIDALTHRTGEPYFDSIERASLNADARDVKLKDLRHNMSGFRNNFLPGVKDLERMQKYVISYNYLVAVKKGEIAAGTPMPDFLDGKPELGGWSEETLAGYSSHVEKRAAAAGPRWRAPWE